MTPKEEYEARRAPIKDQRMAEETAYAARMRKDAAADECLVVLLDGIKAFFEGRASISLSQSMGAGMGGGTLIRFYKERHLTRCSFKGPCVTR
jgi:hypothetical protein